MELLCKVILRFFYHVVPRDFYVKVFCVIDLYIVTSNFIFKFKMYKMNEIFTHLPQHISKQINRKYEDLIPTAVFQYVSVLH